MNVRIPLIVALLFMVSSAIVYADPYFVVNVNLIGDEVVVGRVTVQELAALPVQYNQPYVLSSISFGGQVLKSQSYDLSTSGLLYVPYQEDVEYLELAHENEVVSRVDVSSYAQICGDGVCQEHESSTTCGVDCAGNSVCAAGNCAMNCSLFDTECYDFLPSPVEQAVQEPNESVYPEQGDEQQTSEQHQQEQKEVPTHIRIPVTEQPQDLSESAPSGGSSVIFFVLLVGLVVGLFGAGAAYLIVYDRYRKEMKLYLAVQHYLEQGESIQNIYQQLLAVHVDSELLNKVLGEVQQGQRPKLLR